jgi:hypothetical protein
MIFIAGLYSYGGGRGKRRPFPLPRTLPHLGRSEAAARSSTALLEPLAGVARGGPNHRALHLPLAERFEQAIDCSWGKRLQGVFVVSGGEHDVPEHPGQLGQHLEAVQIRLLHVEEDNVGCDPCR